MIARTQLSFLFVFTTTLALAGASCAHLAPEPGEARIVLWRGARLNGADGARADLAGRTVVKTTAVRGSRCRVNVSGRASVEGDVDCSRLGFVAVRPTSVHVSPGGPVRLLVNGGELLKPKERRGEWIRVGGSAHERYEGWVQRPGLGTEVADQWLEPGLTHLPWVCENGGVIHDQPRGTFLIWIPGPSCRVARYEERDGWVRITYGDQRIRVAGWLKADELAPDREARLHRGSRLMRVARRASLFGDAKALRAFGAIEEGVAVWASTALNGRTLVQTHGLKADVVGWVDTNALSP